MSRYELLLFLHVIAAAAWFGGALLSMVLLELASRAGELSWLVRFGEFDDTLAKVLFIPAALITLVAGFVLVFDGPWSFGDDGWVTGGLILFVAIFALGIGLIVPRGRNCPRRRSPRSHRLRSLKRPRSTWMIRVTSPP